MKKLFKDETYLVSAFNKAGDDTTANGSTLVGFLKTAALRKGLQLRSIGGYNMVGEFCVSENITFSDMTAVMDDVSTKTGLSLFVSTRRDIVGNNLLTDKDAQQKDAFLLSGPRR